MKKVLNLVVIGLCAGVFLWCADIIGDRNRLNEGLIRFHVVADSDSEEDQKVKLWVRDAVIESLAPAMAQVQDVDGAKKYIGANLDKIEEVANRALLEAGSKDTAVVSLAKETFDTRYYDTFTLPAGVYDALRITIGSGEGKNWWCVVFPSLCVPATGEGFEDVAVGAGFSDSLTAAMESRQGYELRFWVLDALGKLENMFYGG